MNKTFTWILNHLKIIISAIAVTVVVIVSGLVILNSYNAYKKADEKYNENDLLVRSGVEAAPKKIAIIDDFVSYKNDGSVKKTKSNLKNNLTAFADELEVEGGEVAGEGKLEAYVTNDATSVGVSLTVDATTFVDIDFVISSAYESATTYNIEDILGSVNFKVNNNTIEGGTITLRNDSDGEIEFHHLVMTGFAIPQGDLVISVNAINGKQAFMPNVRNISVFANAAIANA